MEKDVYAKLIKMNNQKADTIRFLEKLVPAIENRKDIDINIRCDAKQLLLNLKR